MTEQLGVVVMAYGTPARPEDLEAYYTHIRRGRPPTEEQLATLRSRYDAIGGSSGLRERTEAQCQRLRDALEARAPGRCTVVLGQKHAAPFIEDAVTTLHDAGVQRAVGLVLAPHYSGASVGEYLSRARTTAQEVGCILTGIERWHDLDAWQAFQASAVQRALQSMATGTKVLFSAHSLPERVLMDDPYPDELFRSASAIAKRVGLEPAGQWAIAWQSAGATPEPWRGPDLLEVLRLLADTEGSDSVLVCPQGFTSAHLEVRYDLDVEAAALAEELGIAFARTEMLEDDPATFEALADRVLQAANDAPGDAARSAQVDVHGAGVSGGTLHDAGDDNDNDGGDGDADGDGQAHAARPSQDKS